MKDVSGGVFTHTQKCCGALDHPLKEHVLEATSSVAGKPC